MQSSEMRYRSMVGKPFVLVQFVALVVVAGCSRNQGPRTYEYLSNERVIFSDSIAKIRSLPAVKAPKLEPAETRHDRIEAGRAYRAELAQYYAELIRRDREAFTILANAQTSISALNAREVDPGAIDLVQRYLRVLGDRRNLLSEHEALLAFLRAGLTENPNLQGLKVMVALGESLLTYNPGPAIRTALALVKDDIEGKGEAQTHLARLRLLGETAEQDASEALTRRSQLVAQYENRFPGQPWESLVR